MRREFTLVAVQDGGASAGRKVAVHAACRHQRVVRAALDDRGVLHDEDDVGAPNRVEVVGDDETGPAFHQPLERFDDGVFGRASSPVVGSSRIRMGVFRTIARAMAMRRRWPPDSVGAALADHGAVAVRQLP